MGEVDETSYCRELWTALPMVLCWARHDSSVPASGPRDYYTLTRTDPFTWEGLQCEFSVCDLAHTIHSLEYIHTRRMHNIVERA